MWENVHRCTGIETYCLRKFLCWTDLSWHLHSTGPTAEEVVSLTFTSQKIGWFLKADVVKNTESWNQWTERELDSRMLDTGSLTHGFTELTLAYIFACECILMKSVSLYFPNHSCIWKPLAKAFSEAGPCSSFQPATEMIHKSVCSTKEAKWEHSTCAIRLTFLHRNTTKEKSLGFKLDTSQAERNTSTGFRTQTNLQCTIHGEKYKQHTLYRERFIKFPVPMPLL